MCNQGHEPGNTTRCFRKGSKAIGKSESGCDDDSSERIVLEKELWMMKWRRDKNSCGKKKR